MDYIEKSRESQKSMRVWVRERKKEKKIEKRRGRADDTRAPFFTREPETRRSRERRAREKGEGRSGGGGAVGGR